VNSVSGINHEDRHEVYLLHIYRRGKSAGEWIGTIENIAGKKTGRFKNAGELIDWLEAAQNNKTGR